jgi:hypothetical protein
MVAEFDVRLHAAGGSASIVQVMSCEWGELAEVLDEIIDEQLEFDRMLHQRGASTRHARIVTVITLTGAVELLVLLALADF